MEEQNNKNNKIEIATMGKDIEYIKKSLENNEEHHKDLKDLINSFIESSETKFSAKWVEKAVIYIGSLVTGAIVIALIGLILK